MKYLFKEDFSLTRNDGTIYDMDMNPVYTFASQKLFYPEVSLYSGDELVGSVKTKKTFLLSSYEFYYNGEHIETMREVFSWFKPHLELETFGWHVEGNFASWKYRITDRNNREIAIIDEDVFHMSRHFYVDVLDEYSEELILLVVIGVFLFVKARAAAAAAAA